jgi:hypothetical protein
MDRKGVGKIEKKYWSDVKQQFYVINAQLAEIIDSLSLSDEYCFYVVNYPYGNLIVDKGKFYLPNPSGDIVPLLDPSIPENVREDLSYNKMVPTGIISSNSIETFFEADDHTIPVSLYTSGDWLGLWHVLENGETYQTGPLWNISSGARTVYMLPKITDKQSYKRLNLRHGLKLFPNSTKEHWNIFKELSSQPNFSEQWLSEIIFFSRKWFADLRSKKLSILIAYLLHGVWLSSSFRRNQFVIDYAFSIAQKMDDKAICASRTNS